MISESAVYATSGCVYAATLAVLVAWLRNVPDHGRRYCNLMTFVVGLGVLTSFLAAAGIGGVSVGGKTVLLSTFLNDAVAYSVLWFVTAMLADVSRRRLAVVTAFPFVQVVAFQFGTPMGGLVALASTVVVIGGHLVLAYLFVGPIWQTAQRLPDERRLLHWKSRNLLLFLIGMLIAFAFLSLAGAFTAFGVHVLGQYIAVLIRVGFAGFLFVNIDALDAGGGQDASESGVSSAEFANSAPDAAD
ncbi:bacteriorhodopsin [Halorussus sp. MSC15.2]|uniref:bacteriorhodopsin n=1 Tax=Halorussus sp. MSC15.2 TaxID=2283638 RepID=UPI0013D17B94|nr:bacteriorhodopsin [Halorussus sp. MSC15.2]NEU58245.1 bacteriorhodopsin [Halorussus sp. MSC15.2]